MKVDSLLQREGRGPVERTGPIPLPGRRPRHLAAARGRPVDPDAVTEPFRVAVPTRPGAGFAVPSEAFTVPLDTRPPAVGTPSPAVPRGRDPRPTPAGGLPAGPALPRERRARPGAPRRPDDEPPAVRRVPGPVAGPKIAVDPVLGRTAPRPRRLGTRTTLVVVLVLVVAALVVAGVLAVTATI
ncbi:hypothetical protein [Actinomycetospora chiangmaiensis]|uniref:hypothetical protein n=1 Tax=Actinomycetospora chiangmaiensis TaxID=402650 RepID=UPI00037A1100|nr:hypothetical protein [Actinomycetospora chiangmaiensis]